MITRALEMPRRRVAAGVLFTHHDDAARILLVEPTYKPYWDLPGGLAEVWESPRDAAQREVKEELGIVIRVGRLLVVDYMPPGLHAAEAIMFVFAGGVLHRDTRIVLQQEELRSWAWCTPGGQRARQLKAPILARRVAAAREALASGATLYLESGVRV